MHLAPDSHARCLRGGFIIVFLLFLIKLLVFTFYDPRPKINFTEHLFNHLNSSQKAFPVILSQDNVIFVTHKRFLSFSIDSSQIGKYYQIPLDFPKFRRIVSHLSGGYIRIGGNAADLVIFSPTRPYNNYTKGPTVTVDGGECIYDDQNCPNGTANRIYMTGKDWNYFNDFVHQTGFKLLFDLNVMLRTPDGNYDTLNAEDLLDYSFGYHYPVDFELGNEPNAFLKRWGHAIPPKNLSRDFESLKQLLQKYSLYKNSLLAGPDVTRPRGLTMKAEEYLTQFLSAKAPVDAITWHHYYFGPNATKEDFLNPTVYDSFRNNCQIMKRAVKKSRSPMRQIWVGETGTAYGGGAPGLSNRFIGSLMWLDKLGIAGQEGVSLIVRQSLYRANYALIDDLQLEPYPDYWVSILYKYLVGHKVLSVNSNNEDGTLRVYAHCSTRAFQPVVFGVNLVSTAQHLKLKLNTSGDLYMMSGFPDLLSKQASLNSVPLSVTDEGDLPPLEPIHLQKVDQLPVLPHSIFFLILNVNFTVCDFK